MSKKPTTPTPTNRPAKRSKTASPDLFDEHAEASDLDDMVKYGIKCVPVNYYHFGDFRYTNLADAISQAKRGCSTLAAVENPGLTQS